MNISLQIIREDYHPVNIVFQVAVCHPFFFFFDSPDQCCFQIVLQGSYLICFFYLIRWRQCTPWKIPPKISFVYLKVLYWKYRQHQTCSTTVTPEQEMPTGEKVEAESCLPGNISLYSTYLITHYLTFVLFCFKIKTPEETGFGATMEGSSAGGETWDCPTHFCTLKVLEIMCSWWKTCSWTFWDWTRAWTTWQLSSRQDPDPGYSNAVLAYILI